VYKVYWLALDRNGKNQEMWLLNPLLGNGSNAPIQIGNKWGAEGPRDIWGEPEGHIKISDIKMEVLDGGHKRQSAYQELLLP
jgi:hypothetical protein